MEPGTYTILLELPRRRSVTFGAAGERTLDPGYYAYTGSAFGPGGLSRVQRHRELLLGKRDTRHWHIDSLLGLESTEWVDAWRSPHLDRECSIAQSLVGTVVEGIGATDCSCSGHLVYHSQKTPLAESIAAAHTP
ncbi:MAG: GIY-YIG nuclease family protein [Halodesulfurarchaeum sp.]